MDHYNFLVPPPPPPVVAQSHPTMQNSNENGSTLISNGLRNPSVVKKSAKPKDPRIASNSDAWKEHVASQNVVGRSTHNSNQLANGSNGNHLYEPRDSVNGHRYTPPDDGAANRNRKRALAVDEYSIGTLGSHEPRNKRNWLSGKTSNIDTYTEHSVTSDAAPSWDSPPNPPTEPTTYKNAYDAALIANLQASLNLPHYESVPQAAPAYQYDAGFQGVHGYYQQPSNVIYTNTTQIYGPPPFIYPITQDTMYSNHHPNVEQPIRGSAPNRQSFDRSNGRKSYKHRSSGSRWSSGNWNGTETTKTPRKSNNNPVNDLGDDRIRKKKGKKRSITESIPKRPWNKKDAVLALNTEMNYRNSKSTKQIMLRFPDQDLSPEIVKKFHTGIKSVHFQAPSSARYCFVQLEDEVDLHQVISDLNTIPFQNGFLRAEQKTQKDEEKITPEGIDPYTLYLGNLPHNVTSTTVKDQFPNSTRVDIGFAQKIKYTRYAFIRFSNVEDAIAAFERNVNMIIDNRSVVIRFRRGKGTINPPGTVCKEETMQVAARQRNSRRERELQDMIEDEEEDVYVDDFYDDISDDDDDSYYDYEQHGDIPDDFEMDGDISERRTRTATNYDGDDRANRSSQFKDYEYYLSEQYTDNVVTEPHNEIVPVVPIKSEYIKKEIKTEKLKKEERVSIKPEFKFKVKVKKEKADPDIVPKTENSKQIKKEKGENSNEDVNATKESDNASTSEHTSSGITEEGNRDNENEDNSRSSETTSKVGEVATSSENTDDIKETKYLIKKIKEELEDAVNNDNIQPQLQENLPNIQPQSESSETSSKVGELETSSEMTDDTKETKYPIQEIKKEKKEPEEIVNDVNIQPQLQENLSNIQTQSGSSETSSKISEVETSSEKTDDTKETKYPIQEIKKESEDVVNNVNIQPQLLQRNLSSASLYEDEFADDNFSEPISRDDSLPPIGDCDCSDDGEE